MNNNNAPFLLPYSNLYLPIDFARVDHDTKGKLGVNKLGVNKRESTILVSFGRETTNTEFPHTTLNRAVAEVFWGISQHIGRFHMEFLYTRGKVYARTCKRQYSGTINRCSTSLAIPDDDWLELEMMDVLLIRKNPVYLFIRFNAGRMNLSDF